MPNAVAVFGKGLYVVVPRFSDHQNKIFNIGKNDLHHWLHIFIRILCAHGNKQSNKQK